MCGLVGALGPIYQTERRILENLLVMSTLRGVDSTGVAAVYHNSTQNKWTYDIAKRTGHVFNLLDSKKYDVVLSRTDKKVVLGHNRASTVGASSEANAHPFLCQGGIIGTHNGTLTHQSRISLTDYQDYGTDSEALLNEIANIGVEDAMAKADGAWALVWWDMEKDQVHFLRNSERTLYYTVTKDGKNLYYASEPWFLTAALGRHAVEHSGVRLLPEDTMFTWDIRTEYKDEYSVNPDERRKVHGKKPVVGYAWSNAGGKPKDDGIFRKRYTHGAGYQEQPKENPIEETKKEDKEQGKEETKGEVINLPFRPGNETHEQKKGGQLISAGQFTEELFGDKGGDDIRDVGADSDSPSDPVKPQVIQGFGHNVPMTERAYRNLTKETCACCDAVVPFWSPELIKEYGFDKKFVSHDQVICVDCATNPDMEEAIRNIG